MTEQATASPLSPEEAAEMGVGPTAATTTEKPATGAQAQAMAGDFTLADLGVDPDGDEDEDIPSPLADAEATAIAGDAAGIPSWVKLPDGSSKIPFKLPKGRVVAFLRFLPEFTDAPERGERQCILWGLTPGDETLAATRTRGVAMRTIDELAKAMIRSIDGMPTDWSSTTAVNSPHRFWAEIGPRYRKELKNYYIRTHSFEAKDRLAFFHDCVAVRTVGGLRETRRGGCSAAVRIPTRWTTHCASFGCRETAGTSGLGGRRRHGTPGSRSTRRRRSRTGTRSSRISRATGASRCSSGRTSRWSGSIACSML